MKKSKIYIVALLLSSVFFITGCSKDKDDNTKADNCSTLGDAASNAASAFVSNPTEQTCTAYIQAIHDYYDGCTLIDAATRNTYDAWLEQVDCSLYNY